MNQILIKFIYILKIHTKQNINYQLTKEKVQDSKTFIEYSNDMDDIYKNIEEYNPNKRRKIFIVFGDMIADMLSNKKLNPVVTELFLSNWIIPYFAVPKNIGLNSRHYFVMKIPNKRELQQIAFNYSSDIDPQDFMNLYKKCAEKP